MGDSGTCTVLGTPVAGSGTVMTRSME